MILGPDGDGPSSRLLRKSFPNTPSLSIQMRPCVLQVRPESFPPLTRARDRKPDLWKPSLQYLHGPELFLGVVLGGGGCNGHKSTQLVVASDQERQGVAATQRGAHQYGIAHLQVPQRSLQQLRPPCLCAGLLGRCRVPKSWEQQETPAEGGWKGTHDFLPTTVGERAEAHGSVTPNFPEATRCNGIGLLEKHLSFIRVAKLKRLTICSAGERCGEMGTFIHD